MKRLTAASHFSGSSLTSSLTDTERGIGYDLNENMTALTRYHASGLENDLTFFHTGNRMTSMTDANAIGSDAGAKAFTYDANGNLTYDGRQNLEIRWNILNLASGAETQDCSLTYSRLSDGALVSSQKVSGNSTTGKRYCGSFVFSTGTGITTPLVESIAWDEGRIFRDAQTGAYRDCWFAGDHLGDVRSVVDISPNQSSPVVLEQNDYLPFGTKIANPLHAQMDANRWRYAGKEEFPEMNLLDFGARLYDPFTARWTAVDPMARKYLGTGPYVYCANNPMILVDSEGMDWVFNQNTQQYLWLDNVFSAKDTPEGYEYVGWHNNDILTHMGYSQLIQHQSVDVQGRFASDVDIQPIAWIPYSVVVSLSPIVSFSGYAKSENNCYGRVFLGLALSISAGSIVHSFEDNVDFCAQVSVSAKDFMVHKVLGNTTSPYLIEPGTIVKDLMLQIPGINTKGCTIRVNVSTTWSSNTSAGRIPMGTILSYGVLPARPLQMSFTF